MEVKYLEKYKYPTQAMFNITDDCNLACRYCFVQQKPHYMTLETAKKAIGFLERNYNVKKENKWLAKGEKICINFFGGEPTLLFDKLIKPIVNYVNTEKNKALFQWGMTTNGTLLDEEKIIFLKKNNFSLLLSIDGDKETQNYNRPCKNTFKDTSFDLIKKNIPYLLEHFPNITFRSTIYKDTVHLLYNNYLFAKEQGFKNYCAIPDARSKNWDDESLMILEQQLNLICLDQLKYYLSSPNNQSFIKFSNLLQSLAGVSKNDLLITYNTVTLIEQIMNNVNRCGLGTTGISINYEGLIFSCQEQDSREFGEYFIIGNIEDGINKEQHIKILNDYKNSPRRCEKEDYCLECYLTNICSKGCPSTQYDLFGELGINPYVRCYVDNIIMTNAILIFDILKTTNNQVIINIINQALRENAFKSNLIAKEGL